MSLEMHDPRDARQAVLQALLCPRCGIPVKPGKKFCSQCGAPILSPVANAPVKPARWPNICPECGFENHHSDRFCKGCGSLLANSFFATPDLSSTGAGGTESIPATVFEPTSDLNSATPPASPQPPGLDRHEAAAAAQPVEAPAGVQEAVAPPALDAAQPVNSPGSAQFQYRSQAARSVLLRPRGLAVAALGAVIVAGIVLYSVRHRAGRGQPATLSGELLARTSSPRSPGAVLPAQRRKGSSEVPAKATRSKTKPERAGQTSAPPFQPPEIGKTNVPVSARAKGTSVQDGPTSQKTLASPDLSPKTVIPDLDLIKPADPKSASEAAPVSKQIAQTAAPATIALNVAPTPPNSVEPAPAKPPAPAPNVPNIRVGGMVEAAKVLIHPLPQYPELARARRLGGTVHLGATVLEDGTVTNLKIVSGDLMLAGAAVEAVRHWRYQPALVDGQPIESQVDIEIKFHFPE